MSDPTVYDLANKIDRAASEVAYSVHAELWLGAAANIRFLSDTLSDLAAEVAVAAVKNGATQKAVADALGVPSRTLQGVRQEAGVA